MKHGARRTSAKGRKRSGQAVLLRLQKTIFSSLQSEATALLGATPKEILQYEETFRTELRKQFKGARISTRAKLLARAAEAQLVLIGDYHTYQQAQRTALRILRELVRANAKAGKKKVEFVLALEMISSRHQQTLDRFMAGKLPEKEFLSRIDYERTWGFPWEHYAPLFEFARAHGIRVIGLNRPKELLPPLAALRVARKSGDLGARDEWAAGMILDEILDGKRVIAIYGELHLAPSHLPHKIRLLADLNRRARPETLVLHQNQDELFWQLSKKGLEQTTDLVELKGGDFCVFSGTPWTRLQSLINWLQGDLASFTDEDEDPEEEFAAWMKRAGTRVGEFFSLTPPPFDSLTVYGAGDHSWATRRAIDERLTRALIESQERIYWKESPSDADLYAPAFTENSAAELAAIHLLHAQSKNVRLFDGSVDASLGVLLDHAFGFFCSLLLNPRRKCSLREEHQLRLRMLARKKDRPLFRHEEAARKLFLTLDQAWERDPASIPDRLTQVAKNRAALYTGARFFGHMLGKELHGRMLIGDIGPDRIREAFLDPARKSPRARFTLFLDLIGGRPRRVRTQPGESL